MKRLITIALVLIVHVGAIAAHQRGPAPRTGVGRAVQTPSPQTRSGRGFVRPTPVPQPTVIRSRIGQRLGVAAFPIFWGWSVPLFYVDSPVPLPDDAPTGGVQLDVTPWRSRVYADGVLMGRVGDFSGYYHPLELVAGPHQITIVDEGYQPMVLDVVVTPGRTITSRATLAEQVSR
jgi:hypothetical protein